MGGNLFCKKITKLTEIIKCVNRMYLDPGVKMLIVTLPLELWAKTHIGTLVVCGAKMCC